MEPIKLDTPVIGFRTFEIRQAGEGILLPYGDFPYIWKPGPQEAKCLHRTCRNSNNHQVPNPNPPLSRGCGFHGLHEYRNVYPLGVILGWGRIQIHPDGWRSQFAEIVALINNVAKFAEMGEYNENKAARMLIQAKNHYKVPLVDNPEDALAIAKELGGEIIPRELREKAAVTI